MEICRVHCGIWVVRREMGRVHFEIGGLLLEMFRIHWEIWALPGSRALPGSPRLSRALPRFRGFPSSISMDFHHQATAQNRPETFSVTSCLRAYPYHLASVFLANNLKVDPPILEWTSKSPRGPPKSPSGPQKPPSGFFKSRNGPSKSLQILK